MDHLVVNLGFLIPAALCWLGSLYCLGWLRDRAWNPAIAAIVLSFVARGVAFLIGAPTVYRSIDDLAGAANVSRLIINICGVIWSAAVLVALAYWNRPETTARTIAHRWSVIAIGIVVVTVMLWLRAEVPETAINFSARHGHDQSVAAYMLMYHGSLTVGLVAVVVCCARYACLTDVTRLRYGMSLTAVGAGIYLTFCAHRIAGLVGGLVNWDAGRWPLASPTVTGTGAILMMTGLTMPMWGSCISDIRARRRHRLQYRAMTLLWRDLCTIAPSIELRLANQKSLAIEFRLYRRMIEMRDGLLAVPAHLPPQKVEQPGDGMPPITEIQSIALRIHAAVTAHITQPATATIDTVPAHQMRDTEADWLASVSNTYARYTTSSRA